MLVRRGLEHFLNTIRWRPGISMAPAFNHAFSIDLIAVLCLFQIVVPIAGLHLLVRHFQQINTGVVVWLGLKDGSTTTIGTNSTLYFLPVLCLWVFLNFLTTTQVAKDGDLTLKKVGHFVLDKYHKMLSKICWFSQRNKRPQALMWL